MINICLLLITAGCIQQDDVNKKFDDLPLDLTFSADTLDRPEDNGSTFDLKTKLSDKPILILWIAAGCSGCHDWTEMIRESLANQTLNSSTLNVGVHRWAGIESSDRIMEAFGVDTNKSTYTPWTIVVLQRKMLRLVSFQLVWIPAFHYMRGTIIHRLQHCS